MSEEQILLRNKTGSKPIICLGTAYAQFAKLWPVTGVSVYNLNSWILNGRLQSVNPPDLSSFFFLSVDVSCFSKRHYVFLVIIIWDA